jgi:hypothetical protein
MRHLKRLGDTFTIPLSTDEEGFLGRGCPVDGCEGYFKIKLGTGLQGENLPCHCPYCGHTGEQGEFHTKDQREYAKSIVIREFTNALKKDMKDWGRKLRQSTKGSFIQLRMEYKGRPHPVRHYQEKQLETKAVCDVCALEYAIYGVFAYCPDCGTHNSPQILNKNLELANKEIALANEEEDREFAEYLVADALENAVSAFDGFGREICAIHATLASEPDKAPSISFQNITRASERVDNLFGFSLAGGLDSDDWASVCRCFQKRHLLAHKLGVVDQAYINATGDAQAVVGRKIVIAPDEVLAFIGYLEQLGAYIVAKFSSRETT